LIDPQLHLQGSAFRQNEYVDHVRTICWYKCQEFTIKNYIVAIEQVKRWVCKGRAMLPSSKYPEIFFKEGQKTIDRMNCPAASRRLSKYDKFYSNAVPLNWSGTDD